MMRSKTSTATPIPAMAVLSMYSAILVNMLTPPSSGAGEASRGTLVCGQGPVKAAVASIDYHPSPARRSEPGPRAVLLKEQTMQLELIVVEGPHRGQTFPLVPGRALTLGRASDRDVSLPDATVFIRHAEILRDGLETWLQDTSKKHGCEVNEVQVGPGQRCRLRPGDLLQLGRVRLQLLGVVRVERGWLGANDGAVARLALAIADEGRFAQMPALAEALARAGCTDADLLACCAEPGS